ncbi:hypothetical protein BH10PSE12_BH10PSE12_11880 [soil metagenome]
MVSIPEDDGSLRQPSGTDSVMQNCTQLWSRRQVYPAIVDFA